MKLEDLRDDVGCYYLYRIGRQEPDFYIDSTAQLAHVAFYSTLEEIGLLEQSKIVLGHRNCMLPVIYLFLSIESYIMNILKVISIEQGKDFNFFKKGSLFERYSRTINLLGQHNKDYNIPRDLRKQAAKELEEFCNFRDSIFHSNQFKKGKKYNNTIFPESNNLINQVDVIQSMIIAINVFDMFRFSINGLDLMPNIGITPPGKHVVFWEKMDVVYNEIVKPCFIKSLAKHGISTDLNLEISNFHLPRPKIIAQQWKVIVKAEISVNFDFNKMSSTIIANIVNNRNKKYVEDPETFNLADYTARR